MIQIYKKFNELTAIEFIITISINILKQIIIILNYLGIINNINDDTF